MASKKDSNPLIFTEETSTAGDIGKNVCPSSKREQFGQCGISRSLYLPLDMTATNGSNCFSGYMPLLLCCPIKNTGTPSIATNSLLPRLTKLTVRTTPNYRITYVPTCANPVGFTAFFVCCLGASKIRNFPFPNFIFQTPSSAPLQTEFQKWIFINF